jgi:hypothetical protein
MTDSWLLGGDGLHSQGAERLLCASEFDAGQQRNESVHPPPTETSADHLKGRSPMWRCDLIARVASGGSCKSCINGMISGC